MNTLYDSVCPSVGRSVCHNFKKGGKYLSMLLSEHLFNFNAPKIFMLQHAKENENAKTMCELFDLGLLGQILVWFGSLPLMFGLVWVSSALAMPWIHHSQMIPKSGPTLINLRLKMMEEEYFIESQE